MILCILFLLSGCVTCNCNCGCESTAANEPEGTSQKIYTAKTAAETTAEIFADAETEEETVWISQNGSKYHKSSKCSSMKNAASVPLPTAKNLGYTACSRCY